MSTPAVRPQIPFKSVLIDSRQLMSTPWTFYITQLDKSVADIAAGGVTSFNGRTGDVSLQFDDVTGALGFTPAPINSPTFTGIPRADTAPFGSNDTQLATTEFVQEHVAGSSAGLAAALTCSFLF